MTFRWDGRSTDYPDYLESACNDAAVRGAGETCKFPSVPSLTFMGSGVEGNASESLRRGSAPNGHVSSRAAQVKNCLSVALVRHDDSGANVQEPSNDRQSLKIKPQGHTQASEYQASPSRPYPKPGIFQDWRGVLRWTAIIALSCFMWLCIAAAFGIVEIPGTIQ